MTQRLPQSCNGEPKPELSGPPFEGMKRIAFRLAYLGGRYYGFQRQPDVVTVQSTVIGALEQLDLSPLAFCYSGRTDRGVSSLGQVITFFVEEEKADLAIPRIINSKLPWDIWTWAWASVPQTFSARYGAIWREYFYIMYGPGMDLDLMQAAASLLKGTHNFRNFSSEKTKDTVRTLMKLEVEARGDMILITARSDGFLWNMVRKIVMVLETIGSGENDLSWIDELLDPVTNQGVAAAPPEGLIFMDVGYDKSIEWTVDPYSKRRSLKRLKREMTRQVSLAEATAEIYRSML